MLKKMKCSTKKIKYLIICFAISILFTFTLVTLLFNFMVRYDFSKKIEDFVSSTENNIEEKIEEKLTTYLNDQLFKYSRPSSFSLFYEIPDHNMEFFTKIRLSLIDSVRTVPDIEDLVLYRVDDNAVVSAQKSGYSMERLTAKFDDIKEILANGELTKPRFYSASNNKIAYLYPVIHPNRWKDGAYRGFATLYLNNPSEFFNIDINSLNPSGTLIILHESTILHTEGSNTLSDEVIFNMIHTNMSDSLIQKKIHSINYTYYYSQSPNNDIKFLYYEQTPTIFHNLINNRDFLFFYILSLVLIVIFCIAIYILLHLLNSNKKEQIHLTEKYTDVLMKSSQPSSIDLVIERYLQLDLKYTNYAVFVIEPDIVYLSSLTEKQKRFIYEEYKEIAKNLFNRLEYPSVVTLQVKGYISCIINYNEILDFKEFTTDLSNELKKYSNCSFNIFYSDSYVNANEASDAYIKLTKLIKYSFIYNYDNIFTLSELEKYEENPKTVETKVVETIQSYLTDFNPKNFILYLNNVLHLIRTNGYSYNQSIDFFNVLLLTLKTFFTSKSMDYNLINVPLAEQLNNFKSLEECILYIETCMNNYTECLLSGYTSTNRRYIENILQYIDDNTEDITLTSVSEEFHVTPAHLSRIFKENVGINFSEYVTEKKLLRAAKLLRENQNLNIVELANKFGYNTPSYFSTKFKERFGVTPGVYKKEFINIK